MGGRRDDENEREPDVPSLPTWEHPELVVVSEGGRKWQMGVDGAEVLCVAQDGSLVRLPCGGIDGFISAYIRLLEISRGNRMAGRFSYDWRSAC